jgi:signal transduction histidine kinase
VRGAWSWLRDHPWEADLALAALVFLASWDEASADPLIRVVSLALAVTLILRRKYPVQAFSAAAVICALQVLLGLQPHGSYVIAAFQPTASDITLAILLYTLAAHTPRRISVLGLVTCFVLSAAAIARWGPAHSPNPAFSILAAAALLGSVSLSAWVLGDSVAYRYRVAYYAALEDRAARLEAERDAQARIAVAAERARELQERRARAVDESAARLRRIERDLHDGAQVRLTALALTLGEIKEALDGIGQGGIGADSVGQGSVGLNSVGQGSVGLDSVGRGRATEGEARTRMLIEAAHRNAKETLVELRDLARGIHPAVLDRGLDAALSALAETSPTPVELTVRITRRPTPAIEAIAYFCAAELLANVVKHAQASKATVAVTEQEGELVMTVSDNGRGGARISPGGGLDGLRERVQTVDGRLAISSPAAGPTTVTIALPGHA